jgi:hypothetical protein
MEQNYQNQQPQQQFIPQTALPNATAVLVLGILSIVICWCYGIVGIILGIIALVLAKKANEEYKREPGKYTLSSFNNMKAGKVCAIIGLCISSLMLLYVIFWLLILGATITSLPWQEIDSWQHY